MRLSDVKYRDIIFGSKEDIEKIVFDEKNQDLQEKCDVGVVFGGPSMIPHRIEQGISLYQNNQINKILVSGGIGFFNKDRKTPEAIKLEKYLLYRGVPKCDILVEAKSRNTRENIQFVMEILKNKYDLNDTKLALISSDFHIRRCIELLAGYYNREYLFGSGVKDGITDINNWSSSTYGKRLILTEALLLCYYAKQKTIDDIEIKGLTLKKTIKK